MSYTRPVGNRRFESASVFALTLGMLLALQGRVVAQESPMLPGELVRLTSVTPGIGVRIGVVQAINQDTVWLREDGTGLDLAIPNKSLRALFVADGWRHQTGKGALWGLLAGAVLGGAVGSTTTFCIWNDCDQSAAGVGVLVGAPVGLLVGTVVGTAVRSRRWRSVAVPLAAGKGHLELQVAGTAVALSWTP